MASLPALLRLPVAVRRAHHLRLDGLGNRNCRLSRAISGRRTDKRAFAPSAYRHHGGCRRASPRRRELVGHRNLCGRDRRKNAPGSPRHHADRVVCIAIVITGIALGHYTIWWGPAVLLSALTGGSNLSATALKEKNSQLLRAQDEVRTLSRIAERERIGRDLHDLLGRTLTLIAVKADLAERLATRDPDAAIQEVRELGDAAREALRDVRNALSGAREAGLVQELGAARAMLESADITMRIEGDPALVPCGPGGVLGMAIREAVTNVVRHAEATDCTIAIQRMAQCASVVITDNGRGGSFAEGVGLKGMRARMSAAGGTLEIVPQPCGTSLVARVPVV